MSTILDAYTKQILAYALSKSLDVDFVLETVNMLMEKHKISIDTETLIHSDQRLSLYKYKIYSNS